MDGFEVCSILMDEVLGMLFEDCVIVVVIVIYNGCVFDSVFVAEVVIDVR